jgi:glucosylceramidase
VCWNGVLGELGVVMLGWGRLVVLGVAMVAIGGAVFCAPARAGIVTRADYAIVHRPGLTAAERRAITITSVTAASDASLGLIVKVAFRGDIERYLGQGDLKDGVLALLLEPGAVMQAPTGLVVQGGGFTPAAFSMLVRHGKRATVRRGTFDVFGAEFVMRMFKGGQYGAIRDGDEIVFHVAGPVLADVAGIKVKVFATSPFRSTKAARTLTASEWRAVLNERSAAVAALRLDPRLLSRTQLAEVGSGVSSVLSGGVQPELRSEQKVGSQLKTALDDYATVEGLVRGRRGLPLVTAGSLVSAFGNAAARIGRLRNEVAALDALSGEIVALSTPSVQVVQTDPRISQELSPQPGRAISTFHPQGVPVIDVNPQVRYQQFMGIGAAMTDSSAWLIYDQLAASDRLALVQDLFGASGIHLNFLRVPMAASDFTVSADPYSYDDMPAGQTDPSLSQFSIAHDLPYIIPALQAALAVNPGLQILANPWSPPGWMKANGSLENINDQGTLLPSAYEPLADYFVKFIQAYETNGVPIDAITPQNEPGQGVSYPGLALPESDEATFISQYLDPALQQAGLHPKIYGNDLSWDQLTYADSLASGPAAGDLTGIAWHCYFGSPTVMSQLQDSAPGLDQIADECSPELRNFGTPEYLISTLRNWASVVATWNLALDPQGGPHSTAYGCPGCTGVVTINEQLHTVTFTSEYYQLGQVSAFVQPGATRIDSTSLVTYGVDSSDIETISAGLDDVAFQNPDGSLALIAYNNSSAPITFAADSNGHYFTYTLPAAAMTTFVWG